MSVEHIVGRRLNAVQVRQDHLAIALQIDVDGQSVTIELPASEVHALMRGVLSVATNLPAEAPPPEGTEKVFPLTRYEVGVGFPEAIVLVLETLPFGRQGFGMDADTALDIAAALQAGTALLQEDESTPPTEH